MSIKSPKFRIIFSDKTVEENDEFELENEAEYSIPFAEFIKQPEAYFETEADWDSYIATVQHATD